jgi:REP element-mobilizing transposase RayT
LCNLLIIEPWSPFAYELIVAYIDLFLKFSLTTFFCLPFQPIATIYFDMKSRQLKLIPRSWLKSDVAFGASLLKGSHPKKARPFRSKLALHVVLKSSSAVGSKSFKCFDDEIETIIETQAKRHFVRVYGAANAGNHLHLVVQAPSKDYLSAFLKAVSGRIAQLVEGLGKEQTREAFKKPFWDSRPYSRLLTWGREFKNVCRYIGINATETVLGLSREGTRQMFEQIQTALKKGWIVKTPGLMAAGFG